MPGSIVFLSSINMPHFIHPLITCTYHHLFIKLRALREVCFFFEVFHSKKLRTAFCPTTDDFRREYLSKILSIQKFLKTMNQRTLNLKNRINFAVSQTQYAMI